MNRVIREIDDRGGWEAVCDRIADGERIKDVAESFDCSVRLIYTIKSLERWNGLYDDMWEQAMRIRAEAILEESERDFDRLDRVIDTDAITGEEIRRVPMQAEVSLAQGRAKFRQWLAGKLDKERYGDKAGVEVNVQMSMGDLHVQALKQVKARHALPERVPEIIAAEVIE
jgi:hypothetical protein